MLQATKSYDPLICHVEASTQIEISVVVSENVDNVKEGLNLRDNFLATSKRVESVIR